MAFDDPSDASKLIRWAAAIKESAEKASVAWVDYRGKRKPAAWNAFLDEAKNITTFIQMVARVLDIDLAPFRAAESDFEAAQLKALSGGFSLSDHSPSVLGKVSLALRDVRTAAKELMADARDLRSAEGYDYMAFGTDLGIILSSLVPLAKALKIDPKGLVKARNVMLAHFKVITDQAMAQMPAEGGTVQEVPAESIVFAAWAKRATVEVHRNPAKAAAMLDGVLQAARGK